MFLIVPSAVVSLVLVSVIYAVAKSRHGVAGACWLTAATTVISLFLGSPALLLHSLGSLLLALGCGAFRLGPKSVLLASVVAMVASYGLGLSMSLSELHELAELRTEFPLESIADRLAYEERTALPELSAPVLDSKVEHRLNYFEHHSGYSFRSHLLESLHDRTQDSFVMARGFGPVRMFLARRERIELPDAPPVSLPAPPESELYDPSSDPPPLPLAMPQRVEQARPSLSTLLAMHDGGLQDFLHSDRMGYVQDRNHVAGFESHRLLAVPQVADRVPASPWQVVKLELVSLLKHETPVAYVAEHLPQMDKLKDAPTRPLNVFERMSVERLRSEEDLVFDESPNRIRMLGSLRAGRSCLECHSVRRGELLGAFSYELVPESPHPVPKDNVKQPAPQA